FASEEYNEFVGSGFNDVMAFYVNGVNCTLIGGQPVSINTINGGNLNNGTPPSHPELYRDNTVGLYDTEMDGLTRVLTCAAPVKAGQVNHLKLAIADVGDATFDSNVFIAGGSLTTHHPKGPQANASVSQVVTCNPAGAVVTLDASGSVAGDVPITSYIWQWSGQADPIGTTQIKTRSFGPRDY